MVKKKKEKGAINQSRGTSRDEPNLIFAGLSKAVDQGPR